jgi:hypothetical protein
LLSRLLLHATYCSITQGVTDEKTSGGICSEHDLLLLPGLQRLQRRPQTPWNNRLVQRRPNWTR